MYDADAFLDENRIFIQVKSSICGGHYWQGDHVTVESPERGEYTVVFDDEDAGYPILGKLVIE